MDKVVALMLESMSMALDAHTASIDALNERIESLERRRRRHPGGYIVPSQEHAEELTRAAGAEQQPERSAG